MFSANSTSNAIKKEPKIYTCSICQQTFNHDRKLYLHKKKEHPQKSSFSCDTSYKFFSSRPGVRSIGNGKFTCNICKQFYSSKALLNKHEKIHVRHGGKSVSSQGNQLMSSNKRPSLKPDVMSKKYSSLRQGIVQKKVDGISKQYSSLGQGLSRVIKKSENARELYGNLSGSKDCYDIDFGDQQSTATLDADKRNVNLPKNISTGDKKIEDEILVDTDHFMINDETVKIEKDSDETLFVLEPTTDKNEITGFNSLQQIEHIDINQPTISFEGLKEFFPEQNPVQVLTPGELQVTQENAEMFTNVYHTTDVMGNRVLEDKIKLENVKQTSTSQPREKRSYFIGDLLKEENDSPSSNQNQVKLDNKCGVTMEQTINKYKYMNNRIKTEIDSQVTPSNKILSSEEHIVDTFCEEQSPQEKVLLLFKAEHEQVTETAPLNATDDKESLSKWFGKDLSKKQAEKLAKLACRINPPKTSKEIKTEQIHVENSDLTQTNNPPKLCENQNIVQDKAVNPTHGDQAGCPPGLLCQPNLQNISVKDALKFFST